MEISSMTNTKSSLIFETDISWHTIELRLIATLNLLTQALAQESLLIVILKCTQKVVYL